MTDQEAFDKVCAHLLRPDFKQSIEEADGDERCAYAGPDENSCAIGCLLPRSLGEQLDTLDDTSWRAVFKCEEQCAKEAVAILDGVSPVLLSLLQGIHDRSYLGVARLRRLQSVAYDFNLTMPATEQV